MTPPSQLGALATKWAVQELVCRSCLLLDESNFLGFLELCDPEFRYTARTFSPEIRREMVWLDHDKAGLQTLFQNLPRHQSDHAPITRHVTVCTVVVDESRSEAAAISALQAFRTSLDGGITELFAVGKLYDTVKLRDEEPSLLRRSVRLDTRMLGIGSHIPL